tara:strand:- start:291 stop:737 length:447 start_codon:yes stop_codon:yes gene_type:complete
LYQNLEEIYNYYKVPKLFNTSGQPTKEQLILIAKNKYEVVINLALKSQIGSFEINEKKILKSQKVKYIHIPVDFDNPTQLNFNEFVKTIQKFENKKIWVHCKANMRVSSFVYKYRRDILNLDHNEIFSDMKVIWSPNDVWNSFLGLKR